MSRCNNLEAGSEDEINLNRWLRFKRSHVVNSDALWKMTSNEQVRRCDDHGRETRNHDDVAQLSGGPNWRGNASMEQVECPMADVCGTHLFHRLFPITAP